MLATPSQNMRRLLLAIKTTEFENENLFMVKTRVKMQRRGGIFFDGVIPEKPLAN